MSIKHISLFTTNFCSSWNRLQIPGMEPESSSLLLRCCSIADPGHGSQVLLLRCCAVANPEHGSRVLLLRRGKDLGYGSRVLLLQCCADHGYLFSFLPLHDGDSPPLEFVCPFLYFLYFPHTIARTLLWNLLVLFFTFFTFLTGWRRVQMAMTLSGMCLLKISKLLSS
jgi:hypothetical protein